MEVVILVLTSLNLVGLAGLGFYGRSLTKTAIDVDIETFKKSTEQLAELRANSQKIKEDVEEIKRNQKERR